MASAEHTLGLPQPGDASRPSPGARIDPRCRYPKHGTAQAPCFDRAGSALLVLASLFGAVSLPAAAAEPTWFDLPAADSFPQGLAAGPDGMTWVANRAAAEIDAARSRRIVVVDRPRVGRRSLRHRPRVPTGRCGSPSTTGTGSGGSRSTGSSPSSTSATCRRRRASRSAPTARSGSRSEASSAIGRITADGEITEWPTITPRAAPLSVTTGSDGAVWFTLTAADAIGRITLDGTMTEFPLPANAQRPAVDHHRSGRRALVHGSRVQHDRADDRPEAP